MSVLLLTSVASPLVSARNSFLSFSCSSQEVDLCLPRAKLKICGHRSGSITRCRPVTHQPDKSHEHESPNSWCQPNQQPHCWIPWPWPCPLAHPQPAFSRVSGFTRVLHFFFFVIVWIIWQPWLNLYIIFYHLGRWKAWNTYCRSWFFFFYLYINSILFTIFFKSWLVFFSFQFIYWYLLKLWNHLLQLPAVKSWCCLFVPCFTALARAP